MTPAPGSRPGPGAGPAPGLARRLFNVIAGAGLFVAALPALLMLGFCVLHDWLRDRR